jgi:hypothetical protein
MIDEITADDISIDETALDVEWLRQPELMRKIAKQVANDNLALRTSEELLDYEKATMDSRIRKNPENYGLSKVTEPTVAAAILTTSRYRKAKQAVLKARHQYESSKALMSAIEHKKQALENLVKLHGTQYFAGPSVPRNLSEERERMIKETEKESNLKVGKALRRHKRRK